MERRKFKTEEKIAILKEAKENGGTVTLEKHGIYPATYSLEAYPSNSLHILPVENMSIFIT